MSGGEAAALALLERGFIRVDRDGRVFRLYDRRNQHDRWLDVPQEIRPRTRRGNDYPFIDISFEGKQYAVRVHRLVWLAHRGPIPTGLEINHLDGNKRNNRLSNLELTTTAGNSRHAHDTGLTRPVRGERHPQSRLKADQVLEIRRRYAAGGVSTRDLAPEYGVSYHAIWAIATGRTWQHLKMEVRDG